ncbi:MAG: outer membrane beta-barrel protein [Bacteroidota bacterium]|nr:outer membrane beta-barrel protein [Bacteroidota bacterium]
MKKILIMIVVLLMSGIVMAQGEKQQRTTKSFLALHAGPSFPVGDFAKTDINNEQAGFAKTGVNVNLTYGYEFLENVGLTASIFYNNNKMDNSAVLDQVGNVALDHWQWYGISVGPMFTQKLAGNMAIDLRVMGGVANANSPKAVVDNETVVKEDWSPAAVFQGGAGLRIGMGNRMFIMVNLDYLYMKPKFDLVFPDGSPTVRSEQKMSVLNLTAGFGIRF